MQPLLNAAASAYEDAPKSVRVAPAIPILYFGDHPSYEQSPLRIITVALNPSVHEFPPDDRFRRFRAARGAGGGSVPAPPEVKHALDRYFHRGNAPYWGWFGALEPVLSGFGASYQSGQGNTVLHTDLLSPVPTDPTWSRLSPGDSAALAEHGIPLWHDLVRHLRPHIILCSVAAAHLSSITFRGVGSLSDAHVFAGKASLPLRHAVLEIDGTHRADFLFARAAQKPFGFYSNMEKQQIGAVLKGRLRNW